MNQEQINELKAKHGKIYRVSINNTDWIYRPMGRTEFKDYSKLQSENPEGGNQLDLEDKVFDLCCLNGVKSSEIKEAGVVTIIADAIMKATGFTEDIEPEEL